MEKRNLNTEEAAKRIARAAGVPLKLISYAGLKDRQALTRQWFSLHLPGKADPIWLPPKMTACGCSSAFAISASCSAAHIRPMAFACA